MAAMTLFFFPWPILLGLFFQPRQGRSVVYDQESRAERQGRG